MIELIRDTAYFQSMWVENYNFRSVSVNLVSVSVNLVSVSVNLVSVSDNVGRSDFIVSFNVV